MNVSQSLDLSGRLEATEFTTASVEMGTLASAVLMDGGWHEIPTPTKKATFLWAADADSGVLLGAGESGATALELDVRGAGFMPFDFFVDVVLNGEILGRYPLHGKNETLNIPLAVGQLRVGINSVRLISSAVRSPKSLDVSADTRSLGVRLRSVRAVGVAATTGRMVTVKVPVGGVLSGDLGAGSMLVVQDASSLREMQSFDVAGPFSLDLAEEEGRDLMLTTWGDVSRVQMTGEWSPSNLVLIICDTLRADVIAQVDTPNLDALAAEGVSFENTFSHAPMTLPSHTALFSSRYPYVSGVVNNGQVVPNDLPLLADWMARSGYDTRAVASLGTLWRGRRNTSLDRGFRTFEHARTHISTGVESAVLMDEVIADLDDGSPFFLFSHFSDPHEPYRDMRPTENMATMSIDGQAVVEANPREGPYLIHSLELKKGKHRIEMNSPGVRVKVRSLLVAPESHPRSWIKMTYTEGGINAKVNRTVAEFEVQRDEVVNVEMWIGDVLVVKEIPERYRFEVARADAAIGQVMKGLKARGLWDSSLVVFTSDHGEALGEHGSVGHVQTLFDEVIHVPLIIKMPKGDRGASMQMELEQRTDLVVRHIDVVPTILDALGIEALPEQMGISLLQEEQRVLITETHAPEAKRDLYAIRDMQYKMIFTPEFNTIAMYDVATDPKELKDVYASKGAERSRWEDQLRKMAARWSEFGSTEVDESERAGLAAMGYVGE